MLNLIYQIILKRKVMKTEIYRCCDCKTLFYKYNYCPYCHSLMFDKIKKKYPFYKFIFNVETIKKSYLINFLSKILSGIKSEIKNNS